MEQNECKECGGQLKHDKGQDPDGNHFDYVTCSDCGKDWTEWVLRL